jgi:hypothetical protein
MMNAGEMSKTELKERAEFHAAQADKFRATLPKSWFSGQARAEHIREQQNLAAEYATLLQQVTP